MVLLQSLCGVVSKFSFLNKRNSESTDININDKQKAKTEYNQNNNGFENIL